MLAARVATSLVGLPIVLALVWVGGPVFWVVSAIAAAQASSETRRLLSPMLLPGMTWTITVSSVCLVLGAAAGPVAVIGILGLACLALQTEWVLAGPPGSRATIWATGLAAIVSASLPFALLVFLRSTPGPSIDLETPVGLATLAYGAGWVFVALTATWAVDTIAFLLGRAVGKRPFSQRLSPRKTWEGTLAGVVAGTVVVVAWAPPFGWHLLPALAAGLVISIAGVLGDLAESALKRSAEVKDSGSLLPGHGGLLDRIDSLAFSVVVVFLLKALDDSLHVLRWL